MNTNMSGFRWFSEIFAPCSSDKSSLALEGLTNEINPNLCKLVYKNMVRMNRSEPAGLRAAFEHSYSQKITP